MAKKKRRGPGQWGRDEISNPDHEWLMFLDDARRVLGKEADERQRARIGLYLRLSMHFPDRPQVLKRCQRQKFRELVGVEMEATGRVPKATRLKEIYNSVKDKKKTELWK